MYYSRVSSNQYIKREKRREKVHKTQRAVLVVYDPSLGMNKTYKLTYGVSLSEIFLFFSTARTALMLAKHCVRLPAWTHFFLRSSSVCPSALSHVLSSLIIVLSPVCARRAPTPLPPCSVCTDTVSLIDWCCSVTSSFFSHGYLVYQLCSFHPISLSSVAWSVCNVSPKRIGFIG
jgi:hypothetical protein